MFSKRAEPASIASQLVLLFTLAAAFLLSCGLGVFYWLVVQHAFEEDNAVLADKISVLSADLKAGGPKATDEELKSVRKGEHPVYSVRWVDFDCDHRHQTRFASARRNDAFARTNRTDSPERARGPRWLAARASAARSRLRRNAEAAR